MHSERISVGLLTETRGKFSDLIRFGLEQQVRQRMCIVAKLPDLSFSGTCVCRYRTCMAQKPKCIYHVIYNLHDSNTSSTNSKHQQNNEKKNTFFITTTTTNTNTTIQQYNNTTTTTTTTTNTTIQLQQRQQQQHLQFWRGCFWRYVSRRL